MASGLLQRPDDRYANIAAVTVTESAANTITFQEMDFGIGLGAGVALLIDQIDYYIPGATFANLFSASPDTQMMAITARNDVTDLDAAFNNRSIVHMASMTYRLATSGQNFITFPMVNQFFPPIIVGTNRGKLYLATQGISQPVAGKVYSRIYFRYLALTDREYLELAEAFNLMG